MINGLNLLARYHLVSVILNLFRDLCFLHFGGKKL